MAAVILVTFQKKPASENAPELAGFYDSAVHTEASAIAAAQKAVAEQMKLPTPVVKMMFWWDIDKGATNAGMVAGSEQDIGEDSSQGDGTDEADEDPQ